MYKPTIFKKGDIVTHRSQRLSFIVLRHIKEDYYRVFVLYYSGKQFLGTTTEYYLRPEHFRAING